MNNEWEKTSFEKHTFYRVVSKNENGIYEFSDYWRTGQLQNTGQLSNLFPANRIGQFKWYYKNGNLKSVSNFIDNRIIGVTQVFDSTGNFEFDLIYDIDSLDNVRNINLALIKCVNHISKKAKYPRSSRITGDEGKVIIEFYVGKGGVSSRHSVYKSADPDLDNEAIKIVKSFKNWPSPKYKGKEVYTRFYIPINFRLLD